MGTLGVTLDIALELAIGGLELVDLKGALGGLLPDCCRLL